MTTGARQVCRIFKRSETPAACQSVSSLLPSMRSLLLLSALLLASSVSALPGRDKRKAAKLSGYGAPVYHTTTTTTPAPVNLHNNKEFCVDVSAYQPVVWREHEAEDCDTIFVKKCEEKRQNVCATVTETRCEVRPYTECSLGMEPQQYNKTVLTPQKFVEKKCKKTTDTVPHKKYVPECRNVTKQSKPLVTSYFILH